MATRNVAQNLPEGEDYAEEMYNDEVFDFAGIDVNNLLPESRDYVLSVVKATPGIAKSSSNPKIDIQFKVEEGPEGSVGRSVFDTLTFTEKSMGLVKQKLMALGLPADFKGGRAAMCDRILNATCAATIATETSTQVDPSSGEPYPPRSRIKQLRPLRARASAL